MKTHTTDDRVEQLEAFCRSKQMRSGPGLAFDLPAREVARHLAVSQSRAYTLISYLTLSGRLIRNGSGYIYPESN